MLGLLLARKGVDVLVLEKHGDYLRDFRGDTIHPSTMEIMDERGLADLMLLLPAHQSAAAQVPDALGSGHARRLQPSKGALPLPRLHAAVGLPRFRH